MIYNSASAATARSRTAVSRIPGDGAIVQRHCAAKGVERATPTHLTGKAGAARGIYDVAVESTVLITISMPLL